MCISEYIFFACFFSNLRPSVTGDDLCVFLMDVWLVFSVVGADGWANMDGDGIFILLRPFSPYIVYSIYCHGWRFLIL
jgi:hypothetical protein